VALARAHTETTEATPTEKKSESQLRVASLGKREMLKKDLQSVQLHDMWREEIGPFRNNSSVVGPEVRPQSRKESRIKSRTRHNKIGGRKVEKRKRNQLGAKARESHLKGNGKGEEDASEKQGEEASEKGKMLFA
jgi:hypothetical protein